jgi:site-specific DNA-methyltransferase (adenine-specific)
VSAEFVNQLHYGDNLVRLRGDGVDQPIPDEIADLIYLDPPFNSARNYNLLFKQHKGQDSPAQIMTFEDTWTYSPYLMNEFKADGRNAPLFDLIDSLFRILGPSEMMAYLLMMAPRLLELHKKLKPTGSLYLHCDPVASHYLKIILDVVFEPQNFRNEVVWKRTSSHNAARRWADVHDTILFYSKSSEYKWNRVETAYSAKYLNSKYRYEDDKGSYRLSDLTGDGRRSGDSGQPWRGYNPDSNNRHWAVPQIALVAVGIPTDGLSTQEKLDVLDEAGFIYWPTRGKGGGPGFPQYKRYLTGGSPIGSVVTDIDPINSQAKERRGYPTQKPLALLERIIAASTDEGDVVLDPFAGCGTSIVAAERMNRRWIGIDVTYLAINEIVTRLQEEKREGHELKYRLFGTPKDEDAARHLFESTKHQNHKPFEQWAVTLVGGRYNDKKGADRGKDGVIQLWDMKGNYREGVIQVKGGNALNLSNVRDFAHVIETNQAVFGIMIAQREPTKEMRLIAEGMGYADWPGQKKIPRYQILTTQGILERGESPILPESWLIPGQKGVGRAVTGQAESLFDA